MRRYSKNRDPFHRCPAGFFPYQQNNENGGHQQHERHEKAHEETPVSPLHTGYDGGNAQPRRGQGQHGVGQAESEQILPVSHSPPPTTAMDGPVRAQAPDSSRRPADAAAFPASNRGAVHIHPPANSHCGRPLFVPRFFRVSANSLFITLSTLSVFLLPFSLPIQSGKSKCDILERPIVLKREN